MKTIFVLITVLVSLNCFSRATDTTGSTNCGVKGVSSTNSGLTDILKVGKSFSDEQFNILMRGLCIAIDTAFVNNKSVPKFQLEFKKSGIYKGSEEDFTPFLHKFLNDNKQKMICPKDSSLLQKHFYKRMFQLSLIDFFQDYIIDPEMKDLDLNAFEIVNGKKETLLDFIDYQLKKGFGDSDTLIYIRDTLQEEFGAKFGAELP